MQRKKKKYIGERVSAKADTREKCKYRIASVLAGDGI